MAADKLSVSEITTLGRLEKTIDKGMTSFLEVGNALMEIRDKRLYRDRHGTFEAYCQERWGLGRRQANNLIAAAEVVGGLGSALPKEERPSSVRQAIPLKKLPPSEAPAAWQEIVKTAPGGKPTGKHAEKVVARRLAKKGKEDWQSGPGPLIDPDVEKMLGMIDKLIDMTNRLAAENIGHNNHSRTVLATLNKAIGEVKAMEKSWRNK